MWLYRLSSKARFLKTAKFSLIFQKRKNLTGRLSAVLEKIFFLCYYEHLTAPRIFEWE